jgi:hypothetical protein
MKFVGNIKHLIEDRTVIHMMNHTGTVKPSIVPEEHQNEIYAKWVDAGYDLSKLRWEFFTGSSFAWEIKTPFTGHVKWWFSKLRPGEIFPYHIDTYPDNVNAKRYWVAITDYEPGHIFTYGNKVLTDYVCGDMFEFDDSKMYHGACNIGFNPKISMQLVVV